MWLCLCFEEAKSEEGPVVKSVDDFVPDGGAIDSSFLDDAKDIARDNSKEEEER